MQPNTKDVPLAVGKATQKKQKDTCSTVMGIATWTATTKLNCLSAKSKGPYRWSTQQYLKKIYWFSDVINIVSISASRNFSDKKEGQKSMTVWEELSTTSRMW